MYMYAHNGGLREKILIKQEHPRLSITKTILIMGIFSGYMLKNIKKPQLLLCKGLHEFLLCTASYTKLKVTLACLCKPEDSQ